MAAVPTEITISIFSQKFVDFPLDNTEAETLTLLPNTCVVCWFCSDNLFIAPPDSLLSERLVSFLLLPRVIQKRNKRYFRRIPDIRRQLTAWVGLFVVCVC